MSAAEALDLTTQALHEVQQELRVRQTELEALQAVISELSKSLCQAEHNYEELLREHEMALMKLQQVTFVDTTDYEQKLVLTKFDTEDGDNDDDKKPKKKKKKSSKTVVKEKSSKKASSVRKKSKKSEDSKEEKPSSSKKSSKKENLLAKEEDKEEDEEESQSEETDSDTSLPQPPNDSPAQFNFYKIIAERDASHAKVKYLQKQLLDSKKLNKDLSNKLTKSQALIEIAYKPSKQSDLKVKNTPPAVKWLQTCKKEEEKLDLTDRTFEECDSWFEDDDDDEVVVTRLEL